MTEKKPLFSIGVTSYKRIDLLRQCIRSIVSQTFSDFEVLIGNDDPSIIITQEILGISDERVIIYNHPKNLGEVGNMNYLLDHATGDFFTLQADDDLYEPQFLESIHSSLVNNAHIDCVYTKFRIFHGEDYPVFHNYQIKQPLVTQGSIFINNYLEGKCRLMPVCGMFRKQMLIAMGGIKNPSDAPIGLFGEYLLLLSLPLESVIAYIDLPLTLYRVQIDRSIENTGGVWNSSGVSEYTIASKGLIVFSARLFSHPDMQKKFLFNMSAIIALCMPDTFSKWIQVKGRPRFSEIGTFLLSIVCTVRKEVSLKYSLIVAILLIRYIIIQFTYAKTPLVDREHRILFPVVTMLQTTTRWLLSFVYRPPALFWRENDND